MSKSGKAVFLSYASQDAEAAKRICESLRAAGVEVWFDQDALVGGDAWDQKIRGQIGACALFIPVVSAATQERLEGYFRIEWKLAAERTHAMAAARPFLLPVVIDTTRDAEAHVPTEFRTVQWTKLPGGEASVAFVARVQKLLGGPSAPPATAASVAPPATTVATAARTGLPHWVGIALGVVVVALIGLFVMRPGAKDVGPAAKPVPETKPSPVAAPAAVPVVNEKSIAVLPFDNLSDDKENTAFFSDGMHEDILTTLANIPELRVISRTSVQEYRGTTKKIPQIGRELSVAYILEGSVRRAGNQVRITGQLIRAANDEHLWAKSYDRELTPKEVFSIQAALATEIASALKAVLSPETKKLLERRPTDNLAAYDLYLKARQIWDARGNAEQQESRLRAALELDPGFAVAWAQLGRVHASIYSTARDRTAGRLAQAKAAVDTAVRLAPDLPEVIFAVGHYYYYGFRDFARAAEQFERVARLQPKSADVTSMLGALYRRTGRWAEAMAAMRKSVELEPGNYLASTRLAHLLEGGRRYGESRAVWQRIAVQFPDRLSGPFNVALHSFWTSGSPAAVDTFFAGLTATQAGSAPALGHKKRWALMSGNLAELLRLEAPDERGITAAILRFAQGDPAGARARLEDPVQLRSRLEREPANENLWQRLSKAEAMLGHADEALRCARKAIELAALSPDTRSGPGVNANLAFVHAWTGDKNSAIAEYARLLRTPYSELNVYEMKRDPTYAPLRGDPRFEALLNDPKNNAPLF